jgi:hypothetical protein
VSLKFVGIDLINLRDAIYTRFNEHPNLKKIININRVEIDISVVLKPNGEMSLNVFLILTGTDFEYDKTYWFNKDELDSLVDSVDKFIKQRIVKECVEGVLFKKILDQVK